MSYIQTIHHNPSFIHSVFCLTKGPKRFLHIVWSRASSFKWQYPLLSWMSSSSFWRLLSRLLVTSISPFIFSSITCFRRQFIRKMWPIQLDSRFLISCRIFLCSLTLSNTSSFLTWSVQKTLYIEIWKSNKNIEMFDKFLKFSENWRIVCVLLRINDFCSKRYWDTILPSKLFIDICETEYFKRFFGVAKRAGNFYYKVRKSQNLLCILATKDLPHVCNNSRMWEWILIRFDIRQLHLHMATHWHFD